MPVAGRRPGDPGTRDLIVAAAAAEFTEQGYNVATIRSIARRAGVDPALIYHYFGTKSALYVETAELPVDPRQVQTEARQGPPSGARIVERFLAQWEDGAEWPGQRFVAMVQAVAGSPDAARAMREFLTERVWGNRDPRIEVEEWERRRALVSSQLIGTAWMRYVMKLEPLASAAITDVAGWVGPGIERIITGAG